MKKLIVLTVSLMSFGLIGCATIQPIPSTQQAYEQWLNTLKGKDINDLIASKEYAWGPPTSTFNMPNGNKMYTWANIKIGPTVVSGSSRRIYGITFSNYVSITPNWDCYTTIITNSLNIIIDYQLKGNNCLRLDWDNATEDQRKLYFFEQLNKDDKIVLEIKNKDGSISAHEVSFEGVSNMGMVTVSYSNHWGLFYHIEFQNIVSYKLGNQ